MIQPTDQDIAPLFSAQSDNEFASLQKELYDEIKPDGAIEKIYVDDLIILNWEIRCYREYKNNIINNSRLAALQGMLEQLLSGRDYEGLHDLEQAAEDLARGWFEERDDKKKVAKLLRKFGMDEAAIDAEAFRLRSEEVERLEKILTASEFRRDKALRNISDYRKIQSKQLEQTVNQIPEDEVPRLIAIRRR